MLMLYSSQDIHVATVAIRARQSRVAEASSRV